MKNIRTIIKIVILNIFTTTLFAQNVPIVNVENGNGGSTISPGNEGIYPYTNKEWVFQDIAVNLGIPEITQYRTSSYENLLDSTVYWSWFYPIEGSVMPAWKYERKKINIYEDSRNPRYVINQKWNGNDWKNLSQMVFSYDPDNKLRNAVEQFWFDHLWMNLYRYDFEYDEADNLVNFTKRNWLDGKWSNEVQSVNIYNSRDNLINTVWQTWEENTWVNWMQYVYTYDENNNKVGMAELKWIGYADKNSDMPAGEIDPEWPSMHKGWILVDREVFTYDAANRQTSMMNQVWDKGDWVNYQKIEYTYYPYDVRYPQIQSATEKRWVNDHWKDRTQLLYDYDREFNLARILNQEWWPFVQLWVYLDQEMITYDASGNWMGYLHQNWISGRWTNADSSQNYYSTNSVTEEVAGNEMIIFPNPVSDNIYIGNGVDRCYLSDLNGRILKELYNPEYTFSVSEIPDGFYFLNVQRGAERFAKKLVIKH